MSFGPEILRKEHEDGGGIFAKRIYFAAYARQLDYVARTDQQPVYVGAAAPGSATSDAVWQISRCTYDANDQLTKVEWADGAPLFVNIWDNRAALTYS